MVATSRPATAPLPERDQLIEGTTVVFCDVTAEAVRSRAFDRLLSKQQIAWEEAAPAADALVRRRAQAEAADGQLAAGQVDDSLREKELDVVLVEAAPAQIEATLAAMSAQPEDFVTVCVAPAPNLPQKQDWSRFDRKAGNSQDRKQFGAVLQQGQGATEPEGGMAATQDGNQSGSQATGAVRKFQGTARRVPLPADEAEHRLGKQAEPPVAGEPSSQDTSPPTAAMADAVEPFKAVEPKPKAVPAAESPAPAPKGLGVSQPSENDMGTPSLPKKTAPSDAEKPDLAPPEPAATDSPVASPGKPAEPEAVGQNADAPAEKLEEEKSNRIRQEKAKDSSTETATCRVLFVLRAVSAADASAAAAVSAVRAHESSATPPSQSAPQAAEAIVPQAVPAAGPAPSSKR